jgi:hypothetical protein
MGAWKPGWFLLIAGRACELLISAMDIWGLPDALKSAWKVIKGRYIAYEKKLIQCIFA